MFPELTNVAIALIILLASLLLSWIAGLILNFAVHRFARKTSTILDDVFLEAVKGPIRFAIVVVGVQLAVSQFTVFPDSWQDRLDSFFFILYLLAVYVAVYRLISGLADWYGSEVIYRTDSDLDDKFISFFRALANILVTVIMIIILLGRFGIEPSALVATMGIGTLAVALAAQETLSDVISGFMILLDEPFTIGDRVEIQDIDTWGDVTEVGLRSTRILTRDNRLVTVPNSVIGKGLIVNYSNPSTVYRVETHVGIAYGTDVDFARKVMIEALMDENWVMKEKPIEALLLEFGESALVFRVRCWIEHFVETRRVMDKMNSALYKGFNKTDIVLAVPQREVKLVSATVTPDDDPTG